MLALLRPQKLGGGGVGVINRAEGTRLHLFVAVKLLPDDVAHDPQALARLQREAHAPFKRGSTNA